MKTFFELIHLLNRVLLAAFFGAHAILGVDRMANANLTGFGLLRDSELLSLALRALLATIAVWLLFGIRTRVVALLGAVLLFAAYLLTQGIHQSADARIVLILVAVMSLPLILRGGGRFAMLTRGWRDVF